MIPLAYRLASPQHGAFPLRIMKFLCTSGTTSCRAPIAKHTGHCSVTPSRQGEPWPCPARNSTCTCRELRYEDVFALVNSTCLSMCTSNISLRQLIPTLYVVYVPTGNPVQKPPRLSLTIPPFPPTSCTVLYQTPEIQRSVLCSRHARIMHLHVPSYVAIHLGNAISFL